MNTTYKIKIVVHMKSGKKLRYFESNEPKLTRVWWMNVLGHNGENAVRFGRFCASTSSIDYVEVFG